MFKYKFTIFTPTYNRAYILEQLYTSLKRQTYKNFEWLIIDDGSDDNTQDLVDEWKVENIIDIRYIKVENGGKHRAINKALDLAKGELFFIVDSDDYLVNNSLEIILKWEKTLHKKENFIGIAGIKGKSLNNPIGKTFNSPYVDATSLEKEKYNIFGDKAEVVYTNIMKKYKFPEIEEEKFLTEDVVWHKIANDGYKFRWFNEITYICDYLEDGLTNSLKKLYLSNPQGYALYIKQEINFNRNNYRKKNGIIFSYYNNVKSISSLKDIAKNIEISYISLSIALILGHIKKFITMHR